MAFINTNILFHAYNTIESNKKTLFLEQLRSYEINQLKYNSPEICFRDHVKLT